MCYFSSTQPVSFCSQNHLQEEGILKSCLVPTPSLCDWHLCDSVSVFPSTLWIYFPGLPLWPWHLCGLRELHVTLSAEFTGVQYSVQYLYLPTLELQSRIAENTIEYSQFHSFMWHAMTLWYCLMTVECPSICSDIYYFDGCKTLPNES